MATHESEAPPSDSRLKYILVDAGRPGERRVPFSDRLEIGRGDDAHDASSSVLRLSDPTVSLHHCVIVQMPNGRCYVRDTSRNGTRLNGRRLVPNVETEWTPGESLRVGDHELELVGAAVQFAEMDDPEGGTLLSPDHTIATVLVGDISDYTTLVRHTASVDLHRSVSHVFERLTEAVPKWGGTVKEYQGDAILAFWEGDLGGRQAIAACRAALAFDRLAKEMARDPSIWQIRDFPLRMDWALATGPVMIQAFGGARPTALSMIGEPVVLAFRLEKFATADTGPILSCRVTRDMAASALVFRDLGEMTAKGFDRPDRVFALEADPAALGDSS